jgi:hypothetical protein
MISSRTGCSQPAGSGGGRLVCHLWNEQVQDAESFQQFSRLKIVFKSVEKKFILGEILAHEKMYIVCGIAVDGGCGRGAAGAAEF